MVSTSHPFSIRKIQLFTRPLLFFEMHFLNSCTKSCTKPIFRVFSLIFECPKNVLWCIIIPTMHWYYALIYYAIGKFEGFDTFMLTLKRSFVKCIFCKLILNFIFDTVMASKQKSI